jgi:16S rRNA processing protein RimM
VSDAPDLLEVGRVVKPHGLRGEVIVDLTTDRTERLDPGSVLHTDRGPLEVEEARRHQARWIVRFAGHERVEDVESLRGVVLRAEPIDDEGELWVHELVGSAVVLGDGTRVGECVAVQENPAADLLVLDTGALVPVVFVVGHAPGRVTIEPPEGLLDL